MKDMVKILYKNELDISFNVLMSFIVFICSRRIVLKCVGIRFELELVPALRGAAALETRQSPARGMMGGDDGMTGGAPKFCAQACITSFISRNEGTRADR